MGEDLCLELECLLKYIVQKAFVVNFSLRLGALEELELEVSQESHGHSLDLPELDFDYSTCLLLCKGIAQIRSLQSKEFLQQITT